MSVGSKLETQELMNSMFQFLTLFYNHVGHYFVLDTLKCFIEPEEKNFIINKNFEKNYQLICSKTYYFLNNDKLNTGEYLNSFFKFLERISEFHSNLLMSKESEKIFELCVLCVDFQENSNVSHSISQFLKNFLRNEKNLKQDFENIVLGFSGKLIENILIGVIEKDSLNSRELINIIDIYNTKYPFLLKTYLWNFFLNPNHPRAQKLKDNRKDIFIKTILKNRGISKLRKEFNSIKLEML
jgi:hypothetical protein